MHVCNTYFMLYENNIVLKQVQIFGFGTRVVWRMIFMQKVCVCVCAHVRERESIEARRLYFVGWGVQ